MRRADAWTLLAFVGFVVLVGANGTAIALSSRDLAPFWGGAIRFLGAAALYVIVALAQRSAFPRGRALVGAALYGAIGFFGAFAFINWALLFVRPGLAQVVLACVPLVTLTLAVLQAQERFRVHALLGGLLSLAGILVIFRAQLSASVRLSALLALVAAAACIAQGSLVTKRYPRGDLAPTNAVAMGVAGALFLILSLAAREPWGLPTTARSWSALAYLIAIGSFAGFLLYLVVLRRWAASAAAFQWVALPLVAVPVSAYFTGEALTPTLVVGSLIVLAGVYVGALWKPRRAKDAGART